MKILIVDDDPSSRKLLRVLVENHGHSVIEASDGQEGLEKARTHKTDAIISDALMPKMDGFQFLRAVRHDETLSTIPFVFYSAIYTENKEYALALALGADTLIVKPKSPVDFWKEFTSALEVHTSKKKRAAQARSIGREEANLNEYCRIVAGKLEEKVIELERLQEALTLSADEWRNTFEAIKDAICLLDVQGKIVRCNTAMANLFGMQCPEMVGLNCWEIVHANSSYVEEDPCVTVKRTLKRESVILHVSDRWLDLTVDPFFNEDRDYQGSVLIIKDITERKKMEENLLKSEEKYRDLFEQAKDAIFILDSDNCYLDANKKAEEMTGYSRDELLSMSVFDMVPKEQIPRSKNEFKKLATEGGYAKFTGKLITKDGRLLDIEVSSSSINKDGKLIGSRDIVRDITERKQAEEALQKIQALLNETGKMAKVGGWEIDAETLCLLWTEEVYRIHEVDSTYKPTVSGAIAFYAPTSRPVIEQAIQRVIDYGETFDEELEIITAKGSPRWVHAIGHGHQEHGKTNKVFGAIQDITERRKSGEVLASYSRELTELNTASNTLMLITNIEDIYQEICNVIYEVFDLKMIWLGIVEEGSFEVNPVAFAGFEDDYLSKIRVTWDDSPTGMGPTGLAIKKHTVLKTNINDPIFSPWRLEAQKRGFVESVSVPLIYARDKCIGALNFYSDNLDYFTPDRMKLYQIFANQAAIAIENAQLVSGLEAEVNKRTRAFEDTNMELQQLNKELYLRREESDAASRSKTDFLANMSHEFRTPLNAILGFSDIMQQGMAGPVTDKQKEFLADISSSGDHLLSLITDILDLSKIEAGQAVFEPETFTLKELIETSLVMFKEKALKHAIKVTTEIDNTITSITADKRKLKQVLVNLLSNAFKFTPDGGSVSVNARTISNVGAALCGCPKEGEHTDPPLQDRDLVEISVTDTGIGISMEHQQKLFQSFQQIETSLTRKYAGTGLGLSLCRRLIELHGGRIWVESEPGKGSKFTFIIPVEQ